MTAVGVFLAVLTIAGFVVGALLGGRASDKLAEYNRGFPLIAAGIILVALGGYLVATDGAIPNDWLRALGFTAIGFAGGLVVRARDRVIGGK